MLAARGVAGYDRLVRTPSDAGAYPIRPPHESGVLESRLREALRAEASVRWAYLFGSTARGEPFRDLDVALALAADARGAVAFGTIVARLEEAVAPVHVDVADLGSVALALGGRIAREGRVLVDREPEARKTWEVEANGRALDIEPWLARFERLRAKALAGRSG